MEITIIILSCVVLVLGLSLVIKNGQIKYLKGDVLFWRNTSVEWNKKWLDAESRVREENSSFQTCMAMNSTLMDDKKKVEELLDFYIERDFEQVNKEKV